MIKKAIMLRRFFFWLNIKYPICFDYSKKDLGNGALVVKQLHLFLICCVVFIH